MNLRNNIKYEGFLLSENKTDFDEMMFAPSKRVFQYYKPSIKKIQITTYLQIWHKMVVP